MKSKEKLAHQYSKSSFFEHIPKQILRQDAFIAGFEKAREMAISQVRVSPFLPPQSNCLEERINHLGDEEV